MAKKSFAPRDAPDALVWSVCWRQAMLILQTGLATLSLIVFPRLKVTNRLSNQAASLFMFSQHTDRPANTVCLRT